MQPVADCDRGPAHVQVCDRAGETHRRANVGYRRSHVAGDNDLATDRISIDENVRGCGGAQGEHRWYFLRRGGDVERFLWEDEIDLILADCLRFRTETRIYGILFYRVKTD